GAWAAPEERPSGAAEREPTVDPHWNRPHDVRSENQAGRAGGRGGEAVFRRSRLRRGYPPDRPPFRGTGVWPTDHRLRAEIPRRGMLPCARPGGSGEAPHG